MNKQCCHCKLVKHSDDFGWRQVGDRIYIQPWCRVCRGARGKLHTNLKELLKADRERLAAIYRSDYPLDQNNRSEKYMRDKLVKRYQREAHQRAVFMLNYIKDVQKALQRDTEDLHAVWHAVEWYHSGDWSKEDALKAIADFETASKK